MNILIVDLYYETPATAMAANNLVRCFLGAGAAATVNPLIQRMGVQWTYCFDQNVHYVVCRRNTKANYKHHNKYNQEWWLQGYQYPVSND
jgi:hypothetical protein